MGGDLRLKVGGARGLEADLFAGRRRCRAGVRVGQRSGPTVLLCAGLCLVLATCYGDRPTAADLNHWDEACWFGLLACLG